MTHAGVRATRPFGRRVLAASVAAVVCGSVLGACGSSSKTTATPASATGSAPAGATTGAPGGTGKAPSGKPILIGTIAPIGTSTVDLGGIVSALKAGAASLNASGGINGHPVATWSCNEGITPDQTLACARKAVSAKVAALIGSNIRLVGGQFEQILAKGHIVDLENTGLIPEAYSAKNSYAISWELGSWLPCVSKVMVAATQAKSAVMVSNAGDAADSVLGPAMANMATSSGVKWLGIVKVPASVSDWAPYVAQAQSKGADVVVPVAIGAGPQAFVRASSAAGTHSAICLALGLSGEGGWAGLGSAANNLFVGSTFAPPSAANATGAKLVKSFAAEQAAGDKGADVSPAKILEEGVLTWLGVDAFAQVASKIHGTVDAASFEQAVPGSTVTFNGFFPDVNFSKFESGAIYARVFNSGAYLWKWSPAGSYSSVGSVPSTLTTAFPSH